MPNIFRKALTFQSKEDLTMKKLFTLLLALSMILSMGFATTASAAEVTDYKTYALATSEMDTFNILETQGQAVSMVLGNCIDCLLTNDAYGNLVPNMAKEWFTEDGGLTWTFKLNEGMQWVDYQGNPKAEVVAHDWLFALEWVLNFSKNESANTSMPIEMIEGAREYYAYTKELAETEGDEAALALGMDKFYEMVKVEAPDNYTLVYHCTSELTYFPSVATYNMLCPLAPGLIEELGGAAAYKEVEFDQLWYNGPYTITHYIHMNEKVLTANPNYWNKDNVKTFNTVTWKMVESQDVAFNLFQTGELDQVTLSQSTLNAIHANPSSEWYPYLTETRIDKFARSMYFNFQQMDADGNPCFDWNTAVANEAFRQSLYYGLDWTSWMARTNAINPLSIQNHAYTSRGVSTTTDGTDYVDLVMERIGAVVDYENYSRVNKEKFEALKAQAIEELTAQGVTFPIECDYYIAGSNQTAKDNADTLKQMFSDCLGDDYCKLNIKTYVSSASNEVTTPGLHSIWFVGWGADFADPSNFLGQMTYGEDNAVFSWGNTCKLEFATDETLIATCKEFTDKVNAGRAIVDDLDARLNAFADAEAYMIEKALIIPTNYAINWQLTCVDDYSKPYASYGIQADRLVNIKTNTDIYTTEDYAEIKAAYEAK